jgi:hypothetical protein
MYSLSTTLPLAAIFPFHILNPLLMASLSSILNSPIIRTRDWNRGQLVPPQTNQSGWHTAQPLTPPSTTLLGQSSYETSRLSLTTSDLSQPYVYPFSYPRDIQVSQSLLGLASNASGFKLNTCQGDGEVNQTPWLLITDTSTWDETSIAFHEHWSMSHDKTTLSIVRRYYPNCLHMTDSSQLSENANKGSQVQFIQSSTTNYAPPTDFDTSGSKSLPTKASNSWPRRSSTLPKPPLHSKQVKRAKRSACHSCRVKKIRCSSNPGVESKSEEVVCK